MKKILMYIWMLGIPFFLQAGAPRKDRTQEIMSQLQAFTQTWNQGDINAVVSSHYKKSPDTVLIVENTMHGYDEVLHFFQTHYPTSKEMGQISLSNIEVKSLGPRHCMGMGKWSSMTQSGQFGGTFSVVYENTRDGWKIVVDHTTGL